MKIISLSITIIISVTVTIYSLPRFSLKQGDRCIDCHVNPTGGMMRNEDGFFYGKNVISMISPRDKDFPLSNKISESVFIGLDYRTQFLYSKEKNRADFHDMSGAIYLNTNLSDKISTVAKYDFVQSIWEAYAVAKILPNDSYLKVGSFVPDFGIKIDDHTAYTRGGDYGLLFSVNTVQGLIFNPFYIHTGVELGVYINDFIFITTSIGKNKFDNLLTTDPAFTFKFEFTPSLGNFNILTGISFESIKTRNTGALLNTYIYGGFFGFANKYFSLIGEYDFAKNYLSKDYLSSAYMVEASYQLMLGLEAVIRYDNFDPNLTANKDEHSHLIIGFEFFPFSFVELRPQYRINVENPDNNNNAFVLQFHFWY
ncbi:MAG: hypothetical protein N2249_01240 [Melioribacter sp.]|nr:hypothetical protein [Melioribacter sp.]